MPPTTSRLEQSGHVQWDSLTHLTSPHTLNLRHISSPNASERHATQTSTHGAKISPTPTPLLRSLSILKKPTQDHFKHHYTSRRRGPDEAIINAAVLMRDNITHTYDPMNIWNLVSRLRIRTPHPIQRLTEDLDLPFDSGTQHQV